MHFIEVDVAPIPVLILKKALSRYFKAIHHCVESLNRDPQIKNVALKFFLNWRKWRVTSLFPINSSSPWIDWVNAKSNHITKVMKIQLDIQQIDRTIMTPWNSNMISKLLVRFWMLQFFVKITESNIKASLAKKLVLSSNFPKLETQKKN